jgi:hypothetical protein
LPGVANHDGISVSLRAFDDSIRQAYESLFPGDPDKNADLLDWRFRRNPHGEAKFAVAQREEEVVGLIALVPTRLRSGTRELLGYQAIDTAVHPSCRGRGLFVRMGKLAQDPEALGGDVLWGFPNANAARGWYGRLGWTNFGQVPLLMRPLRSSFLLGRLHPKLRAIDLPLIRPRTSSAEVYTNGMQLSDDFDELWRNVAPQFGITVDRSGDWLRWRLIDKPGSDYRCVGQKSPAGDLEAFVAVKVADKHGGRLCYVVAVARSGIVRHWRLVRKGIDDERRRAALGPWRRRAHDGAGHARLSRQRHIGEGRPGGDGGFSRNARSAP